MAGIVGGSWFVFYVWHFRLELTRMLLKMNASVPLADKFHKNTGKVHICINLRFSESKVYAK